MWYAAKHLNVNSKNIIDKITTTAFDEFKYTILPPHTLTHVVNFILKELSYSVF